MSKLSYNTLSSLQNEVTALSTINGNMAAVQTAVEKTLSRDGTSPNTMSASLDMNSNRILNLIAPSGVTEPARKFELDALQADVDATLSDAVADATAAALASQVAAASSATAASSSASAASSSASSASSSASTATTQASAASSSASAASSSASAASSSASTASTQATNAAASAVTAAANSETASALYTFSTTTTDSDPGNGIMRFNNATAASVTAIYFDNLDRDGNTLSGWLDTFDDSTATVKGSLYIRRVDLATAYAVYTVSGSVTDGTGYRKVTVTNVSAGAGSFTNASTCIVQFSRSGDSQAVDFAATAEVTSASNDQLIFFDTSDSNAVKRDDILAVVAAGIAGTSPTLGTLTTTGSIELGNASDTTIARSGAGAVTVEGVQVVLSATSPTLATITTTGNIELGNASDTTLSRSAAGILAVEGVPVYSQIPQNSQSAAYTTVLADAQKHILHPTADNNARTFTIDSNANVAYPIGTMITFVNQINTVTISITSDTLTWLGAGTTGSRTLAASGSAAALKVASTSWVITGVGLT